jgi:hypothetical protein
VANRLSSAVELTSEDETPVMPQKELMISSFESPSAILAACLGMRWVRCRMSGRLVAVAGDNARLVENAGMQGVVRLAYQCCLVREDRKAKKSQERARSALLLSCFLD